MGMEPDIILTIADFENKLGFLMHRGVYYRFQFQNQSVTPDSWQYICLAVSSIQIKIIWNGEILTSVSKVDEPKEEIKDTRLWLGGALFFGELRNRRFEGMITNANFWNNALGDDDLISITNNGKNCH